MKQASHFLRRNFHKGLLGLSTYLLLLPTGTLAATLENFEINTDTSAVKIILHTDQRVQYTTENDGRRFSIILPNTQLSAEQLKRGMPVVIDNKNKFIGRALPLEGNRVKITLPNLTPNRYAISVLQRPGVPSKPSTLATRSSLNEEDHTFETIANSFQEHGASQRASHLAGYSVDIPAQSRVAKPRATARFALSRPHSLKRHRPSRITLLKPKKPHTSHESVTTIALAENTPAASINPPAAIHPLKAYRASEAAKPSSTFKSYNASQTPKSVFEKTKGLLMRIPSWLLGVFAVISGSIGLLGLVGFFMFATRLLSPAKQSTVLPKKPLAPVTLHETPVPKQAEPPIVFEDSATINAVSYLMHPTSNIDEAVQNAVLLRLPHTLRKRDPKQRKPQPMGKQGATFPNPYRLNPETIL